MTTGTLPIIHVDNHYSEVTIGELDLYFFHRTLVAFRANGRLICQENQWGATTGEHLNAIQPDKKQRVTADEFHSAWLDVVASNNNLFA